MLRLGLCLAVGLVACSPPRMNMLEDVEPPDGFDAVAIAETAVPDIAPRDPCTPAPCGPRELCGAGRGPDAGTNSGPGNGLDDNCNGVVDEGCSCMQDEREACFPGPPDRLNVGPCRSGTALCAENIWGACRDAVIPVPEQCDGVDNDCNGQIDDGIENCANAPMCPSYGSGRPLVEYVQNGRSIDPTARSFEWSVTCPTGVSPCPSVMNPSADTLRFSPQRSGKYDVRVAFERADGRRSECRYPLYVVGDGLRIELDWEPKGGRNGSSGVDLDLHVVTIDPTRTRAQQWFTVDDCYYSTCRAPGGRVNWATSDGDQRFAPSTSSRNCEGAPAPYGAVWRETGRCWNPRLDTDNVTCDPRVTTAGSEAFCSAENVNIDNPPDGVIFRIAVNFYRDHGACTDASRTNDVAFPRILIYCNGVVRGSLGEVDSGMVPMPCSRNTGLGSENWLWLAADVRFGRNACGLPACDVITLRQTNGGYPPCSMVDENADVCLENDRVFLRRAGGRPVDADLATSFR